MLQALIKGEDVSTCLEIKLLMYQHMLYGINLELNFMVTFSCIMRLFKYL